MEHSSVITCSQSVLVSLVALGFAAASSSFARADGPDAPKYFSVPLNNPTGNQSLEAIEILPLGIPIGVARAMDQNVKLRLMSLTYEIPSLVGSVWAEGTVNVDCSGQQPKLTLIAVDATGVSTKPGESPVMVAGARLNEAIAKNEWLQRRACDLEGAIKEELARRERIRSAFAFKGAEREASQASKNPASAASGVPPSKAVSGPPPWQTPKGQPVELGYGYIVCENDHPYALHHGPEKFEKSIAGKGTRKVSKNEVREILVPSRPVTIFGYPVVQTISVLPKSKKGIVTMFWTVKGPVQGFTEVVLKRHGKRGEEAKEGIEGVRTLTGNGARGRMISLGKIDIDRGLRFHQATLTIEPGVKADQSVLGCHLRL